jgi:hypothetical protein
MPRGGAIGNYSNDSLIAFDESLFHVCWRRQSCSSCLEGDVRCSWCPIVGRTVYYVVDLREYLLNPYRFIPNEIIPAICHLLFLGFCSINAFCFVGCI